ncbi:MAG TPA: CHRD domain-containing protein [Blastocatellia bacterium]|nr:CHRD domain-containing protein [Blastocatellia bacterium]
MKRTTLAVLMMLLTVACLSSMMQRRAKAATVVFTAALLPSNEVPPVGNIEASGFGNAVVTFDDVANTFRFDVTLSGLPNSTLLILSHIHEGAAGVNGPVRVDSGLTPAAPIPVANGGAAFTRTGTLSAAQLAAIKANPAGFYFNVHSAVNPGGVVRGQLTPQQTTALTAPTLSEWGAVLMFLLIAAVATFFIVGRGTALATAGGSQSIGVGSTHKAIDVKLLARVTLYVEVAVGLGLLAFASSVKPVDIGGALLSGLIVAFVIHMMILAKRR